MGRSDHDSMGHENKKEEKQVNDFIVNLKKLIAMSEKTFDDYAKKDEDPKDTPR